MATKAAKKVPKEKENGGDKSERQQVSTYLPSDLLRRLGLYVVEKHNGRLNMRSDVIIEAIDQMLAREGY